MTGLFANPWGLIGLAAAGAAILFALGARLRCRARTAAWGGQATFRALASLPAGEWDTIRSACLTLALVLTAIAFGRPQWGEVAEQVQRVGLDVVLLVDCSRSMTVTDVAPSRLERARMEIRSLLASDRGNRVGLVAFAGVPLTLSPLTEDSGAISLLLDIADADLIPIQGTNLGAALAQALRLFPETSDRDRLVIVFSDGEDMGTEALAAARTAARSGMKVFCVGTGTTAGGPVIGPNGRPMEDPATGAPAVSKLNEGILRQVASASDGRYWNVTGVGSVAPGILEELSRLKRREYASQAKAMRQEQFAWFLAPALVLLVLGLAIPGRKGRLKDLLPPPRRRAPGKAAAAAVMLASIWIPLRAQSPPKTAAKAMEAFGGGRVTEALTLYRQSLSAATDPDMKAALRYNAGTCLLHLKKYGEARVDLTFALAASDRGLQRKALFNLAQALYGDGRIDDALASLRTLLTSDPSNLEAKKLYEWILRNKPPEPPQEPPQNPPPNSPPPPDLLEQLPMPPPTPPPDQPPDKQQVPPGMKPW